MNDIVKSAVPVGWAEYCDEIVTLYVKGQKWQMEIADKLYEGEQRFGESFWQIEHVLGISHHTMQNWMSYAKHCPPSLRREALSFSHHQVICDRALTDEQKVALLDVAEAKNLTVVEFKELKAEQLGLVKRERPPNEYAEAARKFEDYADLIEGFTDKIVTDYVRRVQLEFGHEAKEHKKEWQELKKQRP